VNTPKTHKTDAQYEARRSERGKRALDALIQSGDRTHPARPRPNWKRWTRAMEQIELVMLQIESEMESCYELRTKRWRSGKNGCHLVQRLADLQIAQDAVTAWFDYAPTDPDTGNYVTLREWKDRHVPPA